MKREWFGKTRTEALKRRDAYLQEHGRLPQPTKPQPVTVEDVVSKFLNDWKVRPTRWHRPPSDATMSDYESTLRRCVTPEARIGKKRIDEVNEEGVLAIYKGCAVKGKHSASIEARVFRHLKTPFNYARERGLVTESVMTMNL